MAPIDRLTVSQKLIRLNNLIKELEEINQIPRKQFLHDRRLQAAVERYFILAIEIITDIGNHLLIEKGGKPGASYEDIIEQLGKKRLIPLHVAKRNKGMAKFRNLLVHVYEVVEPELVHQYLKKAPKEFKAFATAFTQHL